MSTSVRRRARARGSASSATNSSDSSRLPRRAAFGEAELGEDRGARPGSRCLGVRHCALPATAPLVRSGRRRRTLSRTFSCGETVPFQLVGLEPEGNVVVANRAQAVDRAPRRKAMALPESFFCSRDAEAQVLAVADRGSARPARSRLARSVMPGLPRPNGARLRELGAEVERQSRPPWTSASTFAGGGRRSSSPSASVADTTRRRAKASTFSGLDRETRRAAVPAPALEVAPRTGEPAVEIEARDRAPRALPVPSVPAIARPAGGSARRAARRRCRSRPRASRRPRPRRRGGGAAPRATPRSPRRPPGGSAARRPAGRDSGPRAGRRAAAASTASSVSRSSSAASGGRAVRRRSWRGASRKPTHRSRPRPDRRSPTRISSGRPGFCVRASCRSPATARPRFSSRSGTTSATVATATRSRCRRSASEPAPSSASAELPDDPGAAELGERIPPR